MEIKQTIDDLLAILGDMVTDAFSVPLSGGKIMLDRDKLVTVINEIKAALPEDLRHAQAIIANNNEIVNKAHSEAEKIIRNAEEKARVLVNDSAILTEARKNAREMSAAAMASAKETVANAEAQARQTVSAAEARSSEALSAAEGRSRELRGATSKYVSDTLANSETALTNALNELRRVRSQLR